MPYGLAEGISDAYKGYTQEEKDRVDREDELKSRKMKFESAQNQLNQEGFKESVQRLLMGDKQGAMDHWNKTGKEQLTNLEVDEANKVATWTEANGETHSLPIAVMAKMAGVDMPAAVKPSEPWAAGPAKSGVLYRKDTGETKQIPGGEAGSYKGSGYNQKTWHDKVIKDENTMNDHFKDTLGKTFEMGAWAIPEDAKRTFELAKSLASKVRRNTDLDRVSAENIQAEISKRATPWLKTKEQWNKLAVGKAEALMDKEGLKGKAGIWDTKKHKMNYEDWVKKETENLIKTANKELKKVIQDDAGVAAYFNSLPPDFANEGIPKDEETGIPMPTGAPQGAIPEPGTPPPPAQGALPEPTGQGVPPAQAPAQAPAQTASAPPPPAPPERIPGFNPAMHKALGGGQIPVGTYLGDLADGSPILEGQRVHDKASGQSYIIVNGKGVQVGTI